MADEAVTAAVTALAPEPGTTVLMSLREPVDGPEHLQAVQESLRAHFPNVEFVLLTGPALVVEDTLPQWLAWRFGDKPTAHDDWAGLSAEDRAYWEHEAAAVRRAVMRGGYKANRDE